MNFRKWPDGTCHQIEAPMHRYRNGSHGLIIVINPAVGRKFYFHVIFDTKIDNWDTV